VHFKRWQIKTTIWLTHLKLFEVINGIPEETISEEDYKKSLRKPILSFLCILSVFADHLCDVYKHITDEKELWNALNAKFGATDAGLELYIMENNHSVVDHIHEI
jgi:hypothetical protein